MDSNPGYYQSLKDNFLDYPNPIYQQIELDLKRTFPNDKNHATPEKEMQMRNILYSYAKRNPTIGYCQGLNFITAVLLQHLNEEEAFWVLCQVIEYMLPLDYYTTMTGVIIDQRSLELLIKTKFASVSKHLSSVEFDCQAIIFQWFVCLFANSLPSEIVANIWDQFFTRGIIAIFEYALAIFDLMKKQIMAAKEYSVLFDLFRTFPMTITNWKKLSAVAKKNKITWDIIKLKRRILAQEVYQEYEEQHREKDPEFKRKNSSGTVKVEFLSKFNQIMRLKGFEEMDNPTFNSCMEELVNSNKIHLNAGGSCIKEYFAFRCESISIVDDYFGDGSGEYVQARTNSELSFQNTNLQFEDLLVGRNSKMSEIASLETKFKALSDQQIDEFFHNLIPPSLDESTKSALWNPDTISELFEVYTGLINGHGLPKEEYKMDRSNNKLLERHAFKNTFYKDAQNLEPNFFDEFNKMEEVPSDKEEVNQEELKDNIDRSGSNKSGRNTYDSQQRKCYFLMRSQSFEKNREPEFSDSSSQSEEDERVDKRKVALKRMKSFRLPYLRKIISVAQTFRIETRFNKNKLKRKRKS
jgi:hypothetical protein